MTDVKFKHFWKELADLQKSVEIFRPEKIKVKAAYWGAPPQQLIPSDLPCFINSMSMPDRILGFGARQQTMRIYMQLLVARATVEDPKSGLIATALWFKMLDVFDSNLTIGGTASITRLRGDEPTVPVRLVNAGESYIGLSAVLDIQDVEDFEFA